MAYTQNEVKQFIMNELGYPSGQDFTSTTDEAIIKINNSYDLIVEDTLSKYRWGFGLYTVEMGSREDVSDNKYKYRFPVPADFLTLRTLYRDVNRGSVVNDYELLDGYVYTHEKELWLMYSASVEESKWPVWFVEYIKIKGAFDNCFDLTGDTNLLQVLDKRNASEWIKATNIDARQKKTSVIRDTPYLSMRS